MGEVIMGVLFFSSCVSAGVMGNCMYVCNESTVI